MIIVYYPLHIVISSHHLNLRGRTTHSTSLPSSEAPGAHHCTMFSLVQPAARRPKASPAQSAQAEGMGCCPRAAPHAASSAASHAGDDARRHTSTSVSSQFPGPPQIERQPPPEVPQLNVLVGPVYVSPGPLKAHMSFTNGPILNGLFGRKTEQWALDPSANEFDPPPPPTDGGPAKTHRFRQNATPVSFLPGVAHGLL